MAQTIGKLTALDITRQKSPGLYSDGGNLWLQVGPRGSKSWVFRYTIDGRARWMGLGPLTTISLAEARKAAADKRVLLLGGKDPLAEQRRDEALARLASAADVTFESAAIQYVNAHKVGWSKGYVDEWNSSLKRYVHPIIGDLPVASVDTNLVLKVLEPICSVYPAMVHRIRSKMESILDWAKSRELRAGENPARWRGHLKNLLPNPSRIHTVRHFSALPFAKISDFMADLRSRDHFAAAPLELLILTATRSKETIWAKWSEFDLETKTWTIPPERMKAGREHRVPLSNQALGVLERLKACQINDYVFPGFKHGKPLSQHVMILFLKEMGYTEFVIHGFRSTFRDWAADCTGFTREVIEFALAHKVGDMTETSYFRSDLFAKRAKLMQAWADYCDIASGTIADNIVPIVAAM